MVAPRLRRSAGDAPVAIDVTGVSRAFGATAAVDGVDLQVAAGSIVALLGPSGSGKTTLLRMIAGFERPDRGTVHIGDREVASPTTWVEPDRRHIGMVFQDGALFPHLRVLENIAFGDPAAGRAEAALAMVGLADRARAYPHELSGGERQRIALARAMAVDPEVILLDEPFAALDTGLRVALREEVAGILRDAKATAVLVTHDQQEALSLADDVVVMRAGRVEQRGTPYEIYTRPDTPWVARFLDAADVVAGDADGRTVHTALGAFPADGFRGRAEVMVAHDRIVVDAPGTEAAGGPARPGTVVTRSFFGHYALVRVTLADGTEVVSRTRPDVTWQRGDEVTVRVDGPVRVCPADTAADAIPAVGTSGTVPGDAGAETGDRAGEGSVDAALDPAVAPIVP